MTNVIVAIDDIHPEQGWGVEGDVQVQYLENLHHNFGVKFNLFVPSNYHDKFPITKEFVDFWTQHDWIELSNHGHYHACKQEGIGEMEFYELNYSDAVQRIQESQDLWKSCGYTPKGFRAPGWGIQQDAAYAVSNYFEWIAGHEHINQGIDFKNVPKYFVGADGIHETDNINLYGETFMFQSHIQGDWNDNVWSEENYLHFQQVVKYLLSQYNELQFKTISEIK